jgi:hypothetical protein
MASVLNKPRKAALKKKLQQQHDSYVWWIQLFSIGRLATLVVSGLCHIYNMRVKPVLPYSVTTNDYTYKNTAFNTLIEVVWVSNK